MKAQFAKRPVPQKFFSWLFLLALLVSGACTPDAISCFDEIPADQTTDAGLAGTWKVIAYEDLASNTRTVKDSANSWGGLDVLLTFEENRISGKNTTNQVSGTFSYKGTREIQIQQFGGTEIGEPEWGRLFTRAVYQLKTFTIKDRLLTFYYNDGKNTVTLEKQ
jgi:hypothetical protein